MRIWILTEILTAVAWPREPPSWPKYPGRQVQVLNGTWHFAFLGDVPLDKALLAKEPETSVEVPDAFDMRPLRPRCAICWPMEEGMDLELCELCCNRSYGTRGNEHCWGALPKERQAGAFRNCCGEDALHHVRGVALYRTEVEVAPLTAGLLLFSACVMRCLVAVDGVLLADHAGLSPFSVQVPPAKPSVTLRIVTVLVDNRFNQLTHPVHQLKYDWYQGGGLIRSVQFHSLPRPLHLAVEVFPRTLETVDVDLRVEAEGLTFRWRFDDPLEGCQWQQWAETPRQPRGVPVPHAMVWWPHEPNLHRLKVVMLEKEKVLDCVEVRFGLRHVEAKGREIWLNGQPLKLFGFNRHDMSSSFVLSEQLLHRDIQLLKDVGANFVRGAHYAQDQRFLDLCDEHGLLVWEEVLGWQNTPQDFADGIFLMQSLKLADEMVAASVNHPSVIFFGFFNEGRSDDPSSATENAYRSMASHLRERSRRTRLISWGSAATVNDRYLVYADVCSFHHYPAWYPTTSPGDMEEVKQIPLIWEAFGRYVAEAFPDKPLLITEAGAGGLYALHGPSEKKWTEEFQSLLMQMHYISVETNKQIAGLALWQFADVPIDRLVSDEEHRPRGLNNKGVVSLDRAPKLAYDALRLLRNRKPGDYFGLILPPEDSGRLMGIFKV